jgi:hypothetical protein
MINMGGLLGSKAPAPLPAPARPVTAVAKAPALELEDEATLASDKLKIGKTGKKKLRTDIKDPATQTGAEGTQAGVQVTS